MTAPDLKTKLRYPKRARFWLSLASTIAQLAALAFVGGWGLPAIGLRVPWPVIVAAGVGLAAYDFATYVAGSRALDREPVRDIESMVGLRGTVANRLSPCGMVRVRGELWRACSLDGEADRGEEVEVVSQEGLSLGVRRSAGRGDCDGRER